MHVVPENILEIAKGGGPKGHNFRGGWGEGGFLRSFSGGVRVRLVSYQKLTADLLNKLSVILLLTVFKIKIIVFIDYILLKVG